MYWLEKNSVKENDNEKKSTMRLKNPHNKCRSIFGTISNLLGLTDSCQSTYPLKEGSSLINNNNNNNNNNNSNNNNNKSLGTHSEEAAPLMCCSCQMMYNISPKRVDNRFVYLPKKEWYSVS